jgi:hypothetical protein
LVLSDVRRKKLPMTVAVIAAGPDELVADPGPGRVFLKPIRPEELAGWLLSRLMDSDASAFAALVPDQPAPT